MLEVRSMKAMLKNFECSCIAFVELLRYKLIIRDVKKKVDKMELTDEEQKERNKGPFTNSCGVGAKSWPDYFFDPCNNGIKKNHLKFSSES